MIRHRIISRLLPWLILPLVLAGCGGAANAGPEDKPAEDAVTAPDFTYQDAAGNQHRLSDLRGKTVLLNFWATWCPPCVFEMPFLQQAYEQLPEDKVAILAVNVGERPETVAAFMEKHGFTLPVLLDPGGVIADGYRAYQFPTTVIIDGAGIIREYKIGPLSSVEEILARLERVTS